MFKFAILVSVFFSLPAMCQQFWITAPSGSTVKVEGPDRIQTGKDIIEPYVKAFNNVSEKKIQSSQVWLNVGGKIIKFDTPLNSNSLVMSTYNSDSYKLNILKINIFTK